MPKLDFSRIPFPTLDRGRMEAVRDPALVYADGRFLCFHTTAVPQAGAYRLSLDLTESEDLCAWTPGRRLADSPQNFSSPGNVIRVGEEWVLCVQSYPVDPGQLWGNETCRLWTMRSRNLRDWTAPQPLHPAGCQTAWSGSPRQIDPYLVAHDGRYYCFYKSAGQLGALVSEDFRTWREALPERPVLGRAQTPDGSTAENPCIVWADDCYVMFFSPCRPGRGIGTAVSDDLLDWREFAYLDLPALPWAPGGPTAAMVLDLRASHGRWLMGFHGERETPQNGHDAAIGFFWSDDLRRWRRD